VPQRGLRVPTWLQGLEGNEQGRGDWRGEVETMADTAAGRRNVSGLWPGGSLAQVVGSRPRGVRGRVCVLRSTTARTGGECTRGCAAARQTDVERLCGDIRVATACDGLHVRAREQARERMNDPVLAPQAERIPQGGDASACRGETPASSAQSCNRKTKG
jgi:hypothetical protein